MDRPAFVARSVSSWHRRLRRAVLARRRPLAALTAALAVLFAVRSVAPPSPPTQAVLTAARDLPAGVVLTHRDLTHTAFPPESTPTGALTTERAVVGRTTTGPVRSGEAITDVRLLGGSILDGYPGRVAAPVRIGDAGVIALLRVGDLVDVITADPQGRAETRVVAEAVPVLALPQAEESALASGGLVVLAVTDETAKTLAAASVNRYISVVVTH